MKYVLYLKQCILAPTEPEFAHALLGAYRQLEVSEEFLPLDDGMTDLVTFYEVGVVPEDGPQAIRAEEEIIRLNEEYGKDHMVPAFDAATLMRIPKVFEHFFQPVRHLSFLLKQKALESQTTQ